MSDEPPVAVAVPAAAEDESKEEDLTANEAGDAPNAGVTPAENQVCASPQLEQNLFVGPAKYKVKIFRSVKRERFSVKWELPSLISLTVGI